MITETPTLRLHIEGIETVEENVSPQSTHLENLIDLFPQVTGWELQRDSRPPQATTPEGGSEMRSLQIIDMWSEVPPGDRCASREKCESIVRSINEILAQLNDSNRALEKMSANLASAVPVSVTEDDGEILLQTLESIIRQGLTALNLDAAGIYLLDDNTRELNLRVQVGLGSNRLLAGGRRLKDSVADLDALVGNPVFISDPNQLKEWDLPEQFQAAICVPIASHSTPLGTMWFFADEARPFTPSDQAIAELVAGRVASELQREAATREGSVSKRIYRDIDRARLWQQLQAPPVPPPMDNWLIGGNQILDSGLGGALYDFSISNDGSLLASVGDIQGAVFESGLGAATLRGALRSLEGMQKSPGEILHAVNNTLWNCPLGDQIGSLFSLQVEPETGIANWANGGQTGAIIIGSAAEANMADPGSPLGACEDEWFESRQRILLPNSTLFAFTDRFRQLFKSKFRQLEDFHILDRMSEEGILLPAQIGEWIAQLLDDYNSYRCPPDIGYIAIHRQAESGSARPEG